MYASPSFSKAEKKNVLAVIVWGSKYFRPYLYGTKFKVVSDHKPLTRTMSVKDPGSRLLRWPLQLAEYDCEVAYELGAQNSNADALSKIGVLNREVSDSEETDEATKVQKLSLRRLY